jgi:RNA polymerase sigma factor (TIGR02999 family)
MSDVTQILERVERGDGKAAEELLPLVYEELRKLAAHKMAHEAAAHTLQPTALVHEAWLRLTGHQERNFRNRAHFFAAAAEAMRRILVENARRKRRVKHGGEMKRIDVAEIEVPNPMPDEELLALDAALTKLGQANPKAAELVSLCFFTGLTQAEAGEQLGISTATAERTWAFARAWLFREVKKELNPT